MPALPPSPELQEANAAFVEALITRSSRDAHAAYSVIARYARPEPPVSTAERAKRELRTKALLKWIDAIRERREQDARGVVRPPPKPEQEAEAKATMERFRRWLAGDDSAGPFE